MKVQAERTIAATERTHLKVNVFGLGYVGCVSAACLAQAGCTVVGIDVDNRKVASINRGQSPIVEPGVSELVKRMIDSRRLHATTTCPAEAADISVMCVGTPSTESGGLDLTYIDIVSGQIGDYIKRLSSYHVVNIRSTVLPGTVENHIIPILEARSSKRAGRDFGVCMNPEFMREGASIEDFSRPPFTVIGQLDRWSGDRVEALYRSVDAPIYRTSIRVAEMLKYACNSFHALKVTFSNEIGNICKTIDIDGHEVMRMMCLDTKLNLSSYYMKPGFAFGGSCLPKDLKALLQYAKQSDLETPLLSSILPSNKRQIERAYRLIAKTGRKRVGVLGLSFKPGTDDLRESPTAELIETLIGKGYSVKIYDEEVSLARLAGRNKRYIDSVIPHISRLMEPSLDAIIEHSDVLVIAKSYRSWEPALANAGKELIVIDLVRALPDPENQGPNYHGICW